MIVIIDSGSGNLRSLFRAVRAAVGALAARAPHENRGSQDLRDEESCVVSSRPQDIERARLLVLPGQGSFRACMAGLAPLRAVLERRVRERGVPLLGICVGMQVLAERSYEDGTHEGLGWIRGEVCSLSSLESVAGMRVPHMGWNLVVPTVPGDASDPHPLGTVAENNHAYFAHSFALAGDVSPAAITPYPRVESRLVAAIEQDKILAVQFHPEKSQHYGQRLLRRFIETHGVVAA